MLLKSCVPWQVTVVRSRPGLRINVGSIRNEAEIIDAHAKVIGAKCKGRAAGKGSDLNKWLRTDFFRGKRHQGRQVRTVSGIYAQEYSKIPLDQA